MAGASPRSIRVAVCAQCRDKARGHDFDTWQRIKAMVTASHDFKPSQPSL
jgi:hypothetical protein